MDSSPFVDRPRHTSTDPMLEVNSLKFQVKDLENQLSLERLQHEEEVEALKKEFIALQKKSDDYASDQLFYYEANKDLQQKLENLQENNKTEKDKLEHELTGAKRQMNEYRDKYENLKAKDERELSDAHMQNTRLKMQIRELQSTHKELISEVEKQVAQSTKARKVLDAKEDEIAVLHSKLQNIPSIEEVEAAQLVSKRLEEQMGYIQELEHTNLQQGEQIKALRLNKTNTEILKGENETLKAKLSKIDELNDIINGLNLELLQLKEENNKWKIYLNEDDDVKIEEFVKEYKTLKDENLIVRTNFAKVDTELKNFKHKFNELFVTNENLQRNFDTIATASENLTKVNAELEQQRDLAFEESTFLREQLKNLDTELSLNEVAKNTYIGDLEKLVDEYKSKLEKLTSEMPKDGSNKRQRTDDDEDTTRNFQKNIISLEQTNFDLETQVTRLRNENALLIKKLESIGDIKEQKVRILQLRNNPFMKDQLIKKEQLEVLKRENDDLLRKTTFNETIPKSVYDHLQLTNKDLEAKIYELNKRIQRLREIFSAKSNEFVEAIYSVIGYKVDFQKTGKITLHSKFAERDSIVVDPMNGSLKKCGSSETFVEVWDRLIDFWIRERENPPCFLAAMTLELYEKERGREGGL